MGLRLSFLPNFPEATFIQGVRLFQTLEYVASVKFTKILHCAENVAWFVPKEWKGMDYFFTEPFYGQLSGGGLWPRGFIALFSICWIPSRSFV